MTQDLSPAERYAAARRRAAEQATALAGFSEMYDFGLDPFQIEACRALEAGKGVLVAAPTGSGKTIVGEFAVHLALQQGKKCFYTTPIKRCRTRSTPTCAGATAAARSACSPATTA